MTFPNYGTGGQDKTTFHECCTKVFKDVRNVVEPKKIVIRTGWILEGCIVNVNVKVGCESSVDQRFDHAFDHS
jgi:hypothetical protein